MKISKETCILITGINGFIGRYLSNYLLSELALDRIYGIDKFPPCKPDKRIIVHQAEIENYDEVKLLIKGINPKIIFHLAANIKPSRDINDLREMINTNIIGTANLLSAVYENGIELQSFINLGSSEEYGHNEHPFRENQVPDPVSLYSGTKTSAVMLCRMFYNMYKLPVITVRPSLVYGPGQNDRFFIIQAIKKLLLNQDFDMTEGMQTRDFIFVEDLIRALIEVSTSDKLFGQVVNASSGAEYKLRDIILEIVKITGSKSKINFGALPYRQTEIMRYVSDNSKIIEYTCWKPKIDIYEGLKRTINYVKEGSI